MTASCKRVRLKSRRENLVDPHPVHFDDLEPPAVVFEDLALDRNVFENLKSETRHCPEGAAIRYLVPSEFREGFRDVRRSADEKRPVGTKHDIGSFADVSREVPGDRLQKVGLRHDALERPVFVDHDGQSNGSGFEPLQHLKHRRASWTITGS